MWLAVRYPMGNSTLLPAAAVSALKSMWRMELPLPCPFPATSNARRASAWLSNQPVDPCDGLGTHHYPTLFNTYINVRLRVFMVAAPYFKSHRVARGVHYSDSGLRPYTG